MAVSLSSAMRNKGEKKKEFDFQIAGWSYNPAGDTYFLSWKVDKRNTDESQFWTLDSSFAVNFLSVTVK